MGFELLGFVSFLKQAGWAVAGAASLWGLVFSIYAIKKKDTTDEIVFKWISYRLFWLLNAASLVATLGWMISSKIVLAHEGITIIPQPKEVFDAFMLLNPLFYIWLITLVAFLLIRVFKQSFFDKKLPYIFATQLVLISFLISITAWTSSINEQLFFIGHNIHSIFTIGTVIVLDILFLSTKNSLIMKQNIYPFFPTISKVIWVGLSFDFISVALVFDKAIALTPKFFFAQTVIGILIINGALMSGPLTKLMLKRVSKEGKPLSKRQTLAMDLAGTISITSWTTITFIDFFHNLKFEYYQFLMGYLTIIATLFILHHLWEKVEKRILLPHQLENA